MTKPITDYRFARSFVGQGGTGTTESTELDFNIGTREAIEIVAVLGTIKFNTVTAAATLVPLTVLQTLHIEDGTIADVEVGSAETDSFEPDHEVMFEQVGTIAHATTDDAAVVHTQPGGLVVFARSVISPINLTHRVENQGNTTAGCTLYIHYRYVELSDRELAFQFARRRR